MTEASFSHRIKVQTGKAPRQDGISWRSPLEIQGEIGCAMEPPEKRPKCWEIRDCSPLLYMNCSAYNQSDVPCWEMTDTQCSKLAGTPKTCDLCEVYIRWQRRMNPSEKDSPEKK